MHEPLGGGTVADEWLFPHITHVMNAELGAGAGGLKQFVTSKRARVTKLSVLPPSMHWAAFYAIDIDY